MWKLHAGVITQGIRTLEQQAGHITMAMSSILHDNSHLHLMGDVTPCWGAAIWDKVFKWESI